MAPPRWPRHHLWFCHSSSTASPCTPSSVQISAIIRNRRIYKHVQLLLRTNSELYPAGSMIARAFTPANRCVYACVRVCVRCVCVCARGWGSRRAREGTGVLSWIRDTWSLEFCSCSSNNRIASLSVCIPSFVRLRAIKFWVRRAKYSATPHTTHLSN